MGIDGAYNLVVEHALVVVHVAGIVGVEAVQVFRQLCQVIGAAGLVQRGFLAYAPAPAGLVAGHRGHLRVGLSKHLAVAHAAHGIAVAALNHRPKVLCQIIVVGVVVAQIAAQGARHHRYMLVGVSCADGIHVLCQGPEEGGTVEAVGGFEQSRFVFAIGHHLRQAGQRLGHASHLASDIHVPHLMAVARSCPSLGAVAVALHVCAIVHAVPHPQAHVLGYEQRFLGDGIVVDVGGYVDEARQLLVHAVVGCPHPLLVVIRSIHLDEHAVLRRYGVQVAIAVALILLLVAVEVFPRALHRSQLLFRGEVACLPVASQRVAPHEGALLAAAQHVDHHAQAAAQAMLLLLIAATGVCHGHRTHIVARAVSLQLRGGRVPAVGHGAALCAQPVGVVVVVELLSHIETE